MKTIKNRILEKYFEEIPLSDRNKSREVTFSYFLPKKKEPLFKTVFKLLFLVLLLLGALFVFTFFLKIIL